MSEATSAEGRNAPADSQVPSLLSRRDGTGTRPSAVRKTELLMAPGFTGEEKILLRGLATGRSAKQVGRDLKLPKLTMYQLLGDLQRKTGAADDVALAVWAVRHMKNPDQRSR